jgi:FAD synthetase
MTTVLIFGTFDVVHPGHIHFLRQAKQRGDRLVASIARDAFVQRFKGKKPEHSQEQRIEHIRETGLVDDAYLSDEVPGTYSLIDRIKPQVICLGHDQHLLRADLIKYLAAHGKEIELVSLEPYKPEIYKSSRIKMKE